MADNYTLSSFMVKCADEKLRKDLIASLEVNEDDNGDPVSICDYEEIAGGVWIHDDGFNIDVDAVAQAIQSWMAMNNIDGFVEFSYANTCSKPRLDVFNGGYVFITKETTIWSMQAYHEATKHLRGAP